MAEAFIDTSFVVALVNKGDQYHGQAVNLAAQFEQRELVITDAVLLEIGNALARNFKTAPIEIIDHFLTSDDIQIVPSKRRTLSPSIRVVSISQRQGLGTGRLHLFHRDAGLQPFEIVDSG